MLGDEGVFAPSLSQAQQYVLGKVLSFALAHFTKLPAELPLPLLRVLANPQFRYSKATVEAARFDLIRAGVEYNEVSEFQLNGLRYEKQEVADDDLFVAMLANARLLSSRSAAIETLCAGFSDAGGIDKKLVDLNAVQLQKLL